MNKNKFAREQQRIIALDKARKKHFKLYNKLRVEVGLEPLKRDRWW